jgi:hypothetical protein
MVARGVLGAGPSNQTESTTMKKSTRKLSLNVETVRVLSPSDLGGVAGGQSISSVRPTTVDSVVDCTITHHHCPSKHHYHCH